MVQPRRLPAQTRSGTTTPTWQRWCLARWATVVRFTRGQWETYHRCRDCEGEVKFTEDVCPHCGIAGPVVVPMSVPAAIGVFVVLVLCVVAFLV